MIIGSISDRLLLCVQAQTDVLAVREHFAKLGIPTWMDIDGGMMVDMYDSMASGVANAACVVAFMSQRYQDSENCVGATLTLPPCVSSRHFLTWCRCASDRNWS